MRTLTYITLAIGIATASCSEITATLSNSTSVSEISRIRAIQNEELSAQDWENVELVHTLSGHTEPITLVTFSADGKYFASSDELDIIVWDTDTGETLAVLEGHTARLSRGEFPAPITSLAFSPDGSRLVSSSWSQGIAAEDSLIIWDSQTGEKILGLAGSEGCNQAIFSDDGERLISSCGLGVQVWDGNTGEQLLTFYQDRSVSAIALLNSSGNALAKDGMILATVDLNATGGSSGEDSTSIRLWELTETSASPLRTLEGHNAEIDKVAFTADGSSLVSSSYDETIKVWDWQTGQEKQTLSGYSSNPERASFNLSPDSQLIAGDFTGGFLRNLETGEEVKHGITVRQQGVADALAFSPDNKTLVWTGKPPTFPEPIIRLWRTGSETSSTIIIREEDLSDNNRADYESVPLDKIGQRNPQPDLNKDEYLTGNDPEDMVLKLFSYRVTKFPESEEEKLLQEEIEVEYPSSEEAVVTFTQTGLLDDSVAGFRYRVELVAVGNNWEIVWVGRQYKCRSGRGNPDWSKELCL